MVDTIVLNQFNKLTAVAVLIALALPELLPRWGRAIGFLILRGFINVLSHDTEVVPEGGDGCPND
jgi:hypothetical protein